MSTPDPWAGAFAAATPQPAAAAPAPPAPQTDPWAAAFAAPALTAAAPAAPQPSDAWAAAFPAATAAKPKAAEAPKGAIGKSWDWINTPIFDLTRQGAGPIETGIEKFGSELTTPLSVGLLIGTLGGSVAETGLANGASAAAKALGFTLSATDAAAAIQKAKLATDVGFLVKYGYDVGANTLPQFEMNWGDYRAAKTEKDKQKALDRLEEFATESILNTVAAGLATRGIAHDLETIYHASPKGRALANTQLAEGVYDYQTENQVGTAQARQSREWGNSIVDPKREKERNAITLNREAHGDPKILEQQAQALEKAPEKWQRELAPTFRAAKKLSPEQIEVRDHIHNVLNADAQHLKYMGQLPEDFDPYYMPHKHMFQDLDPETGKLSEHGTRGSEEFLKRRTFPSYFESIMAGVQPESLDAIDLFADYHEKASNFIAEYNFANKAASSYMNDGTPMAAPARRFPGYTRPQDVLLSDAEVEKFKKAGVFDELLRKDRIYEVEPRPQKPGAAPAMVGQPGLVLAEKPLGRPEAREIPRAEEPKRAYMLKQRDYVPTRLYVWRPISEAEAAALPEAITTYGNGPVPEQAIMEQGMRGIPTDRPQRIPHAKVPVYVHPDAWPIIEPMLESQVPKNPFVKAFLKITGETKSDLLALSPFHWFTIMNRTFEAGLSPFGSTNTKFLFMPKEIDYYNLTDAQQAALRDGVVTSSTRPGYSHYLEGVGAEKESLINRIPLIGGFNQAIERKLFGPHGWIASVKFDLYDKLKGELLNSKPNLTEVQAGRIAAAQVNNKFGGLNYTLLGRGASTQHTLRALLLAPDFLESTGRSVLDVAGNHGKQLVTSLIAFNAAHWLLARALNYAWSGNTHPESDFSVLSPNGKRQYEIRTTLGDFLRFAEDPKKFLANRVNPIGVRAPAEIVAGEDEFGNKITSTQQFFDTLRQVTPIPIQGIFPQDRVTQPEWWENPLHSIGIGAKKHFTPAETMARELREKRMGRGGAPEGEDLAKAQLRYKLEDELRTAINAHDSEARLAAIKKIHEASRGADAKLTHDEGSRLIEQANKYPMPLQSAVAHLALADALEVWQTASIDEKRALRPIIQQKVESWMKEPQKHTRQENDTMRTRIQAFRHSLAE